MKAVNDVDGIGDAANREDREEDVNGRPAQLLVDERYLQVSNHHAAHPALDETARHRGQQSRAHAVSFCVVCLEQVMYVMDCCEQ